MVIEFYKMCFHGAVAAHLTGMHSAIKMLNSRIRVLFHHLVAIQKGTWCKCPIVQCVVANLVCISGHVLLVTG